MRPALLILLQIVLILITAYSHGSLHERIKTKTAQIEANPENAELYKERGFLYYQHREYQNAIADYKNADELGYEANDLNYRFAEAYYGIGEYKQTVEYCVSYLEQDANDVRVHRLKGQAYLKLEMFEEAIGDLQFVVDNATDVFTENFIELAAAHEHIGTDASLQEACKVLGSGLERLGDILILEDKLIELELQLANHAAAIEVMNCIIDRMERKEKWLYKRAEIYLMMEEKALANDDLEAALEAIEQLPSRIRSNKSMTELKQSIIQTRQTIKL